MASYTPAQLLASYNSQQLLSNLWYNDGSTTGFVVRAGIAGASVIATVFGYFAGEGFFTGKFPLKYYTPQQATVLGTAGMVAVMMAEGITTGSLVAGQIVHAAGDTDVTILAALRGDGYTSGLGQVINSQIDPPVTPAVIGARIYHNTNQAIGNGTVLTFNSETFDLDTMHDPGDPTKLTCKTDGYYVINTYMTYTSVSPTGGSGAGMRLYISLNGATVIGDNQKPQRSAGVAESISVTAIYHLAVGDYIQAVAAQDGTAMGVSSPAFSAMLIR